MKLEIGMHIRHTLSGAVWIVVGESSLPSQYGYVRTRCIIGGTDETWREGIESYFAEDGVTPPFIAEDPFIAWVRQTRQESS